MTADACIRAHRCVHTHLHSTLNAVMNVAVCLRCACLDCLHFVAQLLSSLVDDMTCIKPIVKTINVEQTLCG